MAKQVKAKGVGRVGRPKTDPNAPAPPTLSVDAASKRYKVGRDQMKEAVVRKQVPTIEIGDRVRIITSLADKMFGLTAA